MPKDEILRHKTVRIRLGRAGRKSVRLDKPFAPPDEAAAAAAKEAAAASVGWIEMLRRAMRRDTTDRRGTLRHDVLDHDVHVGWWTGDHFGAVSARLINISRGGARVVLSQRPPKKEPIWLYKELNQTLAFARGELVATTPAAGGVFNARIRFVSPCPTILCEATICGGSPHAGADRAGSFRPKR